MSFDPHGDFNISRKGEIIVLQFFHSWNLKEAEVFLSHYQTFVTSNGIHRFGVLSDLSQFGGGTPEAIGFFSRISDWAQEHGQIARALIVNTALSKYTVDLIDNKKHRFPIRLVSNQQEAFDWFRSLGLSTT